MTDDEAEQFARQAEIGYDDRGRSLWRILALTPNATVWAHTFREQFGDTMPDEATLETWFLHAMNTARLHNRPGREPA